jgi:hypothetical protein
MLPLPLKTNIQISHRALYQQKNAKSIGIMILSIGKMIENNVKMVSAVGKYL